MDFQKYIPGGSSKSADGAGGDYQHYMDYQKYMSQGDGKNDSAATADLISTNAKGADDGSYSHFYKGYVPEVKNWSNREEVNGAFVKEYAKKYAGSFADSIDLKKEKQVPSVSLAASNVSLDVANDRANASSRAESSDVSPA